jgi:hypothetical protein
LLPIAFGAFQVLILQDDEVPRTRSCCFVHNVVGRR